MSVSLATFFCGQSDAGAQEFREYLGISSPRSIVEGFNRCGWCDCFNELLQPRMLRKKCRLRCECLGFLDEAGQATVQHIAGLSGIARGLPYSQEFTAAYHMDVAPHAIRRLRCSRPLLCHPSTLPRLAE